METTQIIRVSGIVQGVGFRPFVSRIADVCHIRGSVCNKGPYVEIIAQGSVAYLKKFHDILEHDPPPRSVILQIDTEEKTDMPVYPRFDIIKSAKEKGDIFVSPDIAVCDACKKELFDKNDRRYLHPFINCTACGPRLTILDSMPYDRERTSMGEFRMCGRCRYEYTHAETRRYDAQPVCCNDCGPEVYLIGRDERNSAAVTETRRIISGGGIAAVKGIGGFHLCCDASNDHAVSRLRTVKRRPAKPFAVMMRELAVVQRECVVFPQQKEILEGHQKPILLLEKKKTGHMSKLVSPGNPDIGVMLPYAPIQLLLFTYDDDVCMPDIMIMTSANAPGTPICRTDEDAVQELSSMCDVILSHDRTIRLRADDSVMCFYADKPYMIRRSRGYAPLPFRISGNFKGEVLGVGGELKNTFCIGKGNLFYPSPYIGDMSDVRTMQALRESIVRMETLLEARPSIVACDMHPRYNTTIIAQEQGILVLPVQHHYAHILSCMAENDYADPVIGVVLDGTGYGTDGTVWGGEILQADYDGFIRRGCIAPFHQIGGDMAAREGWRIAISMLYSLLGSKDKTADIVQALQLCDEQNLKAQFFMADHHISSIVSTSAGRLFDAVCAVLGICRASTFEGEAAMALEFAAEAWKQTHDFQASKTYRLYHRNDLLYLPADQLMRHVVEGVLSGKETGRSAYEFHYALAEMIVSACRSVRDDTGLETAALSGGVFQNRLLLRLCDESLAKDGFLVLKHSMVPPNDGGIALGQAVAAMLQIQKQ